MRTLNDIIQVKHFHGLGISYKFKTENSIRVKMGMRILMVPWQASKKVGAPTPPVKKFSSEQNF